MKIEHQNLIMEENVNKLWKKFKISARNILIMKKIKVIELERPNGATMYLLKKIARIGKMKQW